MSFNKKQKAPFNSILNKELNEAFYTWEAGVLLLFIPGDLFFNRSFAYTGRLGFGIT